MFVGYGNPEQVWLDDLLDSKPEERRIVQETFGIAAAAIDSSAATAPSSSSPLPFFSVKPPCGGVGLRRRAARRHLGAADGVRHRARRQPVRQLSGEVLLAGLVSAPVRGRAGRPGGVWGAVRGY